jgi:hypothetical protein
VACPALGPAIQMKTSPDLLGQVFGFTDGVGIQYPLGGNNRIIVLGESLHGGQTERRPHALELTLGEPSP